MRRRLVLNSLRRVRVSAHAGPLRTAISFARSARSGWWYGRLGSQTVARGEREGMEHGAIPGGRAQDRGG